MNYVIPALILTTFIWALIKKVPLFDTFAQGGKEAAKLTITVFPYLAAIFILLELMRLAGISKMLSDFLAPALHVLGIPREVSELIILRPLSGSGSLAMLETIHATYGVDSYIARCAAVISASSDTVFYITAVYLSTSKDKRTGAAIPIALAAAFAGAVIGCAVVRLF
jgi:spore maturation protein B